MCWGGEYANQHNDVISHILEINQVTVCNMTIPSFKRYKRIFSIQSVIKDKKLNIKQMNGLTFLRIEKHNLKRKQSNYIHFFPSCFQQPLHRQKKRDLMSPRVKVILHH